MSLDDAARETCIGVSYLEALEADRYEQLPSPAYVKGIIRSYARILGIAPGPLVDRYAQGAEPKEEDEEHAGRGLVLLGQKLWLQLLIMGVVICVGYLLTQRDAGHDLTPVPAGQMVTAALPLQAILPPRSSPVRVASPTVVPAAVSQSEELSVESKATPVTRKSVLKAKILSPCQLTMIIDDMPSQLYDLKPGDQVEWIGERYFALEMTDAGAMEAELNGRPLPPLGKSGAATTVVVTADGQIQ